MGKINRIVGVLILSLLVTSGIVAQNNTNSPYSRYGYGELVNQGFGRNQAMGGVGFALRDNSQINPLNPAAYSAMDSLTFLFEGGVSFQNTNFKDGSKKLNAKNSSLEYLAIQFRLKKWMAMSVGVLPISNVGYSIEQADVAQSSTEAYNVIKRTGNGGIHKIYAGIAAMPMKNLSVGMNVGFLWGSLKRNMNIYFPNLPTGTGSTKQTARNTTVSLRGLTFDFGAQYIHKLANDKSLTFGVVFTPKVSLHNDIEVVSVENVVTIDNRESKYDLASSLGFGVSYQVARKLTISADGFYQKWDKAKYYGEEGALSNYARVAAGVEYLPNYMSRTYFAKVKYRFGAHLATPYYKIDGVRASKEYGVSAGLGLPLPQGKSQLNISAEFVRVNGQKSHFLNETMFRINLGLVFNERWFFKRKI